MRDELWSEDKNTGYPISDNEDVNAFTSVSLDEEKPSNKENSKGVHLSFLSLFIFAFFSAGLAFLLAYALLVSGVVTVTSSQAPPTVGATGQPLVDERGAVPNWVAVAQSVKPSTVSVRVVKGDDGAQGAGFVYDDERHIVTNAHVINGQTSVSVQLDTGLIVEADVVGVDISTDIAVLRLHECKEPLTPVSLGDSSELLVGQPVAAIGNPLGLSQSMTTGIISALNRPVNTEIDGDTVVTNAIQIDAATNQGNSGGALVDGHGRVVGVTSAYARDKSVENSEQSSGIGFAIPINLVKSIANELIASGSVSHAQLGASGETVWLHSSDISQLGAHIKKIETGSAASKVDLRVGDTVIACNGNPIVSFAALDGTIRTYRPGDRVTFTVVRNGQKHDVIVTLGG